PNKLLNNKLAFSAYSAQLNTTNLLSEEKILLSTAYLYIVSANVLFPTPVGPMSNVLRPFGG
ncbi:hypothetical protein NQ663_22405, partial [Acinetobacter baumannii]|nr:hypothetical protein [Acinetobacter baumannii]